MSITMDLNQIILREEYLDHLWSWKDHTDVIKIVTGMRRCGKSTLLIQYIEKLRESGAENIVYIDFESKAADDTVDYRDLNKYIEKNIDSSKRAYIFLDEIQRVQGWERTLNSLLVDYDADVYVTGSNEHMLSSELSTYLSGRYVEIKMLPLSFKEYIKIHPADSENSIEKRFQDYLEKGALPLINPDDEMCDELIQGRYSTTLRKYVLSRLEIVNVPALDKIVMFLMSNVGNVTSSSALAKETSLSPATVKRYLQGLEDAFLIYKAYRYDIKGKRMLKTTEKYYAADTGMRNVILHSTGDAGRMLENAVFLELLRRGYSVTSGSYYDREIDFIAAKGKEVRYYQVALTILDENTFNREVRSLEAVPDNYPKTILTLDRVISTPPNGIVAMNVIDWMLGKQEL